MTSINRAELCERAATSGSRSSLSCQKEFGFFKTSSWPTLNLKVPVFKRSRLFSQMFHKKKKKGMSPTAEGRGEEGEN